MDGIIPTLGAACEKLKKEVHAAWQEAARAAGIDLSGFDPNASLTERIAWAISVGLAIATILARYSTKEQKSTTAQSLDATRYGATHKIYTPPEFVCVD